MNSQSPYTNDKTTPQVHKDGGLYKNLNVPVRTLSILIIGGLILLVFLAISGSQSDGFSVRYNSQGGSDVTEQKYKYLDPLSEPEAPSREGYTFEGWALDQACTAPVEFGQQVEQEMELYACWKADE